MKSLSSKPCTFCGKLHSTSCSGGEWHTPSQHVYCCRACATSVLPALIADSIPVTDERLGALSGQTALTQVELTFWRALTARIARAIRG